MVAIFLIGSCGIFVPSDDYVRGRTQTNQERTRRPSDGTASLRRQVVDDATELVGVAYRYGGVNPQTGMDCSGLMNYVFQNVGITLRRSSREQVKDGKAIRRETVRPGDLVFFQRDGRVFHVGVVASYDGETMDIIHSTSSRGVIRQEILHNGYWGPKIHSYRNVIGG